MPPKIDAKPAGYSRLSAGTIGTASLAIIACVVGIIAGIVLTAHRRERGCTDADYSDYAGADSGCYDHYDAALGIAIICIAFAVLALILVATKILIALTPNPDAPPHASARIDSSAAKAPVLNPAEPASPTDP